jgi:RNA polymerase sigma-70 factor, ECF subfamily
LNGPLWFHRKLKSSCTFHLSILRCLLLFTLYFHQPMDSHNSAGKTVADRCKIRHGEPTEEMASPTRDSIIELALLSAVDAAPAALPQAVEIEEEVVLLFDEFHHRLLRYAISLGIGLQDGEDVIQEVFLSLFRHLRLGRPRSNLRGWIFRVAHHLALKHRNSTQRQQARIASDALWVGAHADPAANPEERFGEAQRQQQLLLVFNALPERDRWCLCLRAEGLRYREIADVLGMSLGAVSNSLARSLERLSHVDER